MMSDVIFLLLPECNFHPHEACRTTYLLLKHLPGFTCSNMKKFASFGKRVKRKSCKVDLGLVSRMQV